MIVSGFRLRYKMRHPSKNKTRGYTQRIADRITADALLKDALLNIGVYIE